MRYPLTLTVGLALGFGLALLSLSVRSQEGGKGRAARPDAVAEAQRGGKAPADRPEARRNEHDRSDVFDPTNTPPSSVALDSQPEKGKMLGFDFRRDPLNSKKPMMTFEQIKKEDEAAKPKVTALQRKLLETRYILEFRP